MTKLERCFKRLDLVPTTDLSAINVAYRKMSKACRPEKSEAHRKVANEVKEAHDCICTYLESLKNSQGKHQKPIFPPANSLKAVSAASTAIAPLREKMDEMRKLLPKSLKASCAPAFEKLNELRRELEKVYYRTHKYVETEELKFRRESFKENRRRLSLESSGIDPADIEV